MLDLFALTLILLCSSESTASPVRRYTNGTRISVDCYSQSSMSTSKGSTATSALVVDGPTLLASFLIPAQETTQSASTTAAAAAASGSAQAYSAQTSPISFSYAPLPYNQSTTFASTAQPTHLGSASLSDWTLTLTTYTTVTAKPKVTASAPDGAIYSEQPAALSAPVAGKGSAFSYNSESTRSRTDIGPLSITTAFVQPYFSTTSLSSAISAPVTSSQSSHQTTSQSPPSVESASSRSSATETSSLSPPAQYSPEAPATSPALPEIVASPTASSSTSSGIAGITIVPLDPSVIYITTTVTDAGATTTIDSKSGKETVTVTVR